MKLITTFFAVITIFLLPSSSFAQMTSENFVLEGPAFSEPNTTNDGSSTNYQTDRESGRLYIYDAPVTPPTPTPPSTSGGGSQDTKTDKGKSTNTGVLSKYDSITICHQTGAEKYVVNSNVQVFITLAQNGPTAELRGHDGHVLDIVPAFQYDLGVGVQTYAGKNWNAETQVLHANNCALFLQTEESPTTPTTPAVDIPVAPVPPIAEPVSVCNGISQPTTVSTAVSENTTVTFSLPEGSLSSPTLEAQTEEYVLRVHVQPVANDTARAKANQLQSALAGNKTKSKSGTANTSVDTFVSQEAVDVPTRIVPVLDPDCVASTPSTSIQSDTETPVTDTPPDTNNLSNEQNTNPTTDSESEITVITESGDFSPAAESDVVNGVLVAPFEIIVIDEAGNLIDEFESPIYVDIFNPAFVGAEHITILQPSADGTHWYEVPFTQDGDTVTIEVIHPGQFFVWLTPRVAIAAEDGVGLPLTIPQTLAVSKNILVFLETTGITAGLMLFYYRITGFPFTFGHFGRLTTHGWNNLFGLLTFRKRRRPWGTVYDSQTKAPVDPAFVEIFNQTGESVTSAVTDLDGRYGFLVPNGTYTMQVKKTNYTFPSQRVSVTGQDVLYHNLYYGEAVEVTDAVTYDIPMDAAQIDWNQYEKMRTKQTRFIHRFDPLFVIVLDALFFVGALAMFWQFVSKPSLLSALLMMVYLVMLYLRFTGKRPLLYGFLRQKNAALPFALVKVYAGNTMVTQRVADEYGRYFALVSPGTYRLEILKPLGNGEYGLLHTTVTKAKRGVINTNIRF